MQPPQKPRNVWDETNGKPRPVPGQRTRPQTRQATPPPGPKKWYEQKMHIRKGHVILIAAVLVVFGVITAVSGARLRSLQADLRDAREEVVMAYEEVNERERMLAFSATDAYIEQQARERFGYIRKDEYRFVPQTEITGEQPVQGEVYD